jgi:glycosyltransferase involved in cell wall biosynthesis
LVHPTGNPNARNAARAFAEAGWLKEVVTTIHFEPSGLLGRVLRAADVGPARTVLQELGRREWHLPPGAKVSTHLRREVLRVALGRMSLPSRLGLRPQQLTDWVYRTLDAHVAREHLDGVGAVYAYEDGAATTFAVAKPRGITCIYELPIAFYRTSRAIQQEEARRFPAFSEALQAAHEPEWKLARKEAEVALSDIILVPSQFVRTSLVDAGVPPEKIHVIPFGSPVEYFQPAPRRDGVFRALFVGRVGPRKGVHYLLEAWAGLKLPDAELLLIGNDEFPEGSIAEHQGRYRHIPSVPHATLNDHYTSASVFVLPSLVEGLPLVLLEAMSCGIPIITTKNAGGLDLITDGVEGFVLDARDTEALKEKILWCYQNPQALAEMGRAARLRAEQLTWLRYRRTLINALKGTVETA